MCRPEKPAPITTASKFRVALAICHSCFVVCTDDRETRSAAAARNPVATPPFAPHRASHRRRFREPRTSADIYCPRTPSICIRTTLEILREGGRSSLLLARPAEARLPELRQRLVDLNLALHIAPPVFVF